MESFRNACNRYASVMHSSGMRHLQISFCQRNRIPLGCILLCDIYRHFASAMLHFASLISHNLRCIPAYTHQIPNGISSQTFFGTTCISILNLINFHPITAWKKSFRIFEFSNFFWDVDFFWGGGGAKKTSRAITAREAKNHSYKLFGAELHDQRNSTNSN